MAGIGLDAADVAPVPEGFRQGRTVDELAFDRGIVALRRIGKPIAAAAGPWNDGEDLRYFVEGIHERRLGGRRRRGGDG